jgi:hypothetical protein
VNRRVASRDLEATKQPSPEAWFRLRRHARRRHRCRRCRWRCRCWASPGCGCWAVGRKSNERHVVVETAPRLVVCRECGQRAESGGRHVVQVRDLPVGARATRLIWHKREWRCRDCGRSWRERHPDIPSRAVLTTRARRVRQPGAHGRAALTGYGARCASFGHRHVHTLPSARYCTLDTRPCDTDRL